MRRPADGGSSDGARCCRCAVLGASFLCVSGGRGWEKDGGDTPPDALAVPVVERDAEAKCLHCVRTACALRAYCARRG